MQKEIRKDIFEIHKPSAMISAEYQAPVLKRGKLKGFEPYFMTPFQHDAMNFMCYKAREQINQKYEAKLKEVNDIDEMFEFLEIQQFELNLNELADFAEKYQAKQHKRELSYILDGLQSIQVKAGIFKNDSILGEIHAVKTMSLLRNYTKVENSSRALYQLEPEILLGWLHKKPPFTKLYLKIQTKLKYTYSKVLYEICKDYENQNTKVIKKPLDKWLTVLGFDKNVKATKTVGQLKQVYLNKAIEEINENTDIFIENIFGKKQNNVMEMIVEFRKQKCELLEDNGVLEDITTSKYYSKSKSKLDDKIKKGYNPPLDEERWIAKDIEKYKERYAAELRIDKWLSEEDEEIKKFIFEQIAFRNKQCDDPYVTIKDYKLIGIFSDDEFLTQNAEQTLLSINEVIEEINDGE